MSPSGEKFRRAYSPFKEIKLPKLGIPLLQVSFCTLPVALWELWLGKVIQNDDALATATTVNNKLSIVSDSGISYILLATMKLAG